MGRQSANEEFLEEIADPRAANTNQRIFESQHRSTSVARRIVEVRDSTGGHASQYAGIIRLPAAVVTFADHCIRQRIQNSRSRAASCLCRNSADLV